jgi:integrase
MAAPYLQMASILSVTGWHITELQRFAKAGSINKLPEARSDGTTHYLETTHKVGDVHRTAVTADVADTALVVKEYGGFSKGKLTKAMAEACGYVKPNIKPAITPGRYRHSVATWAVENGASLQDVSSFLGHKTLATTKKFYATFAVVRAVRV